MRLRLFFVPTLMCTLALIQPHDSIGQMPTPDTVDLKPFWVGGVITNDPLLFIQTDETNGATAKLLFKASANLRVTNPDGTTVYDLDRDYHWEPGSDTLTLTPDSRILHKTRQEMFPQRGSLQSFGQLVNDRQKAVLFSEGRFFQNLQVVASYDHKDSWAGAIPPGGKSNLSRTTTKLTAKQRTKIVLLGDSISAGCNSSLFIDAPPHTPPYIQLVVDALKKRFAAPVTLANLSVGGTDSKWGTTMADKVIAEQPDLVVIAFGMNDRDRASVYATNVQTTVSAIKSKCPDADFILVAGMTGNPTLTDFPKDRFESYRDALKAKEGPGIAVADVTSVWLDILKQKKFTDLTGNGVNHPNDFGHRVYADVILNLFFSN